MKAGELVYAVYDGFGAPEVQYARIKSIHKDGAVHIQRGSGAFEYKSMLWKSFVEARVGRTPEEAQEKWLAHMRAERERLTKAVSDLSDKIGKWCDTKLPVQST